MVAVCMAVICLRQGEASRANRWRAWGSRVALGWGLDLPYPSPPNDGIRKEEPLLKIVFKVLCTFAGSLLKLIEEQKTHLTPTTRSATTESATPIGACDARFNEHHHAEAHGSPRSLHSRVEKPCTKAMRPSRGRRALQKPERHTSCDGVVNFVLIGPRKLCGSKAPSCRKPQRCCSRHQSKDSGELGHIHRRIRCIFAVSTLSSRPS